MGGLVPPAPSPTDYRGSASASNGLITTEGNSTVNSGGSSDVWGLGELYDKPVLLGTTPTELPGSRMGLGNETLGQTPNYGTTQEFMQHVVDLWAAQSQERAQHPHRLTTYEQLQRSLFQAGFYGSTPFDSIDVGQLTSQTQDALVSALGQYEQLRKGGKLPFTFSEFLSQNAVMGLDGGPADGSSGESEPPPFQAHLADPVALKATAQNAALQALGRALPEAELDKFVAQFQAELEASQRDAYDGKGTITTPDAGSEAMEFVQEHNPKAYHANQHDAYVNALVQLFGGVRPGIAPTPSVEGE